MGQAGNYQNFQAPSREEAAKGWNKEQAGQSKAPKASDVRWLQVADEHNCWKINTRSTVYERNEDKESSSEADDEEEDLEERPGTSKRKPKKEVESGKPSTSKVPDESGEQPVTKETAGTGNLIDTRKEVQKGPKAARDLSNPDKVHLDKGTSKEEAALPDVADEVEDHLREIMKEKPVRKKSVIVANPFLQTAQRNLHYDIMEDIKKRMSEATIGQLLNDNPKYRKVLADSLKVKRRRLPTTFTDVKLIGENEDWGAPEIDVEIEGCLIKRCPVDGGSGVNVMTEQTATDLGYTSFEPTPKILRMANQEEVIPLGKISRVLTRLGELEWALNYVVIKLPIPLVFPILLGRPWLYKAGVLEDWKKKEFRIGTIRIPWGVSQEESTATPPKYTFRGQDSTDDTNFSDCWIVVNALKIVIEEDFGFFRPE